MEERRTKTIELTGYAFGSDPDWAAEIVWHVVRTCADKKLSAQEVTVARTSLRVVLDVTMKPEAEVPAFLQAATGLLVEAVKVGAAAGRLRGGGSVTGTLVNG